MVKVPAGPVRLREKLRGGTLVLEPSAMLGFGGEARVFAHPADPSLVAKVYHEYQAERVRKLEVMLENPPSDPMAARGHASIVWPQELLLEADGEVAGFVMPRVEYGAPRLFELYNPKTRRRRAPLFHWQYLHRTARNLASCVAAVHARGYVVGDVNESNLLANDRALVTMVDTDSFQVRDPRTGHIFRCRVGKPEFTPPELHGQAFADVDRTVEHDRFGLAVLIFLLLMEGTHPFTGRFKGSGDPPDLAERIRAGHFPYGRSSRGPFELARLAPPLEILHPRLQELVIRTFEGGHRAPGLRPSAEEWQAGLEEAEKALVACRVNAQHLYGGHLPSCVWCERAAMLHGRDAFPSQQAVSTGAHLVARASSTRASSVGVQHGLPPAGLAPPASAPTPRQRQAKAQRAAQPKARVSAPTPSPAPATSPAQPAKPAQKPKRGKQPKAAAAPAGAGAKAKNAWATSALILAVLGMANVGRPLFWWPALAVGLIALALAARRRGAGIKRLIVAGLAGWIGLSIPEWTLPELLPALPYTETAPADQRETPGVAPTDSGLSNAVGETILIDGRPMITGRAPRPEEEPERRLRMPADDSAVPNLPLRRQP